MNRDTVSLPPTQDFFSIIPLDIQLIVWTYYADFLGLSEIVAYYNDNYPFIHKQWFSSPGLVQASKDIINRLEEIILEQEMIGHTTWISSIIKNIWTLELALKWGYGPKIKESETVLQNAIIGSNLEAKTPFNLAVVKKLLAEGVKVNLNALLCAVQYGHAGTVEALVKHGVSQMQLDSVLEYAYKFHSNETPIELRLAILKILLQAGADEESRRENSLSRFVVLLLENHVSQINIEQFNESKSCIPSTPLNELYGNGELLHKTYTDSKLAYLDNQAIDDIFHEGFTTAITYQKTEWAKIKIMDRIIELVKLATYYKVNINIDKWLIRACEDEYGLEPVKLLLENKADVNSEIGLKISYGTEYQTPLWCAINNKKTAQKNEIIEELLKKNADVNYQAGTNCSLLMAAVRQKDIEVIKLLMQYGAEVTAAFKWASKQHNYPIEIINLLQILVPEEKDFPQRIQLPEIKTNQQNIPQQIQFSDIKKNQLKILNKKFERLLGELNAEKKQYKDIKQTIEETWNYVEDDDKYQYLYELKQFYNKACDFPDKVKLLKQQIDQSCLGEYTLNEQSSSFQDAIFSYQQDIEKLYDKLRTEFLQKLQKKYRSFEPDCQKAIGRIDEQIAKTNWDAEVKRDKLAFKQKLLLCVKEKIILEVLNQATEDEWISSSSSPDCYLIEELYTQQNLVPIKNRLESSLKQQGGVFYIRAGGPFYKVGVTITYEQIKLLSLSQQKSDQNQSSCTLLSGSSLSFLSLSSPSSSSSSSSSTSFSSFSFTTS